jgi:hypothetical protein
MTRSRGRHPPGRLLVSWVARKISEALDLLQGDGGMRAWAARILACTAIGMTLPVPRMAGLVFFGRPSRVDTPARTTRGACDDRTVATARGLHSLHHVRGQISGARMAVGTAAMRACLPGRQWHHPSPNCHGRWVLFASRWDSVFALVRKLTGDVPTRKRGRRCSNEGGICALQLEGGPVGAAGVHHRTTV